MGFIRLSWHVGVITLPLFLFFIPQYSDAADRR